MSAFSFSTDKINTESLIGRWPGMEDAATTMLTASQLMLSAASALASGLAGGGARERELTAEAVELGMLRALRRESSPMTGEESMLSSLVRSSSRQTSLPGTGYGKMGATITGQGAKSQTYGAIGGAIGYAVGGPIGGLVGGMIGGLFGGDDDEEQKKQEEARQWANTPEGFEIESYLYNLTRAYAATAASSRQGSFQAANQFGAFGSGRPVLIAMSPGAVQITGQGEESGLRAARAFAGSLGRALRLNSVVVPAAGLGGDY
jgi:hypothetical protein